MPWRIRILFYILLLATVLIVLTPSSLFMPTVEASGRRIQEFNHSVDSVVRTTRWVRSFVPLFCSICFFDHKCLTILFYTALSLQVEESDSIRSKNPRVEEFDHLVDSVVMRTTRQVCSFVCSFVCFVALFLRSHVSNDSTLHCCSTTIGWIIRSDPVQESPSSIGHCQTTRTVYKWPSRFTTFASQTSSTFALAFLLRSLSFLKVRVRSWRVISSSARIL